jgi:protein TonB
LLLASFLSACGDSGTPPPESAGSTPVAPPTEPANPAPASAAVADSDAAAARGEQALRDQRLFLPAGDSAFEWFLGAVEADPRNTRARVAMEDLVPYAVLHVEQQLQSNQLDEAARVLELITRAAPQAPALPRLQSALDDARDQVRLREERALASEQAAAEAREAAQRAAAEAATPPPAAAAPASPTPAPAPAPVATEPPPPAPAAPPPPRVPEVLFRPPLRYPAQAARRRIEGEVELEFTIAADGSVSEVEVIRSQPEGLFEREAVGAMQRWRFARPEAPMRARRTLEFRLGE